MVCNKISYSTLHVFVCRINFCFIVTNETCLMILLGSWTGNLRHLLYKLHGFNLSSILFNTAGPLYYPGKSNSFPLCIAVKKLGFNEVLKHERGKAIRYSKSNKGMIHYLYRLSLFYTSS